ncbi:hypothetical protein ACC674_06280 [Rhizobium ruizarguesonis]
MFTPSRFVVVDNEKAHLQAIGEAFQALGISSVGIHYGGGPAIVKEHFGGVRVLFMDLHLNSGAVGTDDKAHFGTIASILEDNISETGGPFILVLWTQHPQKAAELTQYLEKAIALPHARPLAVLAFDKNQYIAIDTGAPIDPEKMRQALKEQLTKNPQINALLSWEAEVHQAAAATLASLLKLIPDEKRTTKDFSAELDVSLSRLASEAVGKKHVESDIRGAINSVFAPILVDRLHAMKGSDTQGIWKEAVTKYKKNLPALTPAAAGALNQMLHVEVATEGPDAWGAVITLPDEWKEARSKEMFGAAIYEILEKEFKIEAANIHRCVAVLVRVGAVCDYAQKKRGPIPFLLGIEKPTDLLQKDLPGAIWASPIIAIADRVFELQTSDRYLASMPEEAVRGLQVRFRMREQILMELITHTSNYMSRPGKIALRSEA